MTSFATNATVTIAIATIAIVTTATASTTANTATRTTVPRLTKILMSCIHRVQNSSFKRSHEKIEFGC
jgi:hypothetical protein